MNPTAPTVPLIRLLPAVSATAVLLLASVAAAERTEHPISITEAQIFVSKNTAQVRIKLFAEDLNLFHSLEANEADMVPASELRRGLDLHRDFLLRKFTLRDVDGNPYAGQVTDVVPFEIPEQGIPLDDLMNYTATYALEYPFATPPEFLTIQQDISDENYILPSEMKLALFQSGSELTYTNTLKPGASETLKFDWSDEQLNSDSTDEEWEAWFEKQRNEALGITSYDSVYSFIYVEPAEVRHEVLIPLASLRLVLPMEHEDPAFVDIPEQDAVRELIKGWFSDCNPTLINGQPVTPEFTRIDFLRLGMKDLAKVPEPQKISLANGRVGVIMTYKPTNDIVREVSIQWDKFNGTILRKMQSRVFTYPEDFQFFDFSRFQTEEENTFTWAVDTAALPTPAEEIPVEQPPIAKLSLPVATIIAAVIAILVQLFSLPSLSRVSAALLIVAAMMWPFARTEIDSPFQTREPLTAANATDVFQDLHSGAYSALEFGSEQLVYDILAKSVDGDLLETLYLQLNESLAIKEQGGAVARVQAVNYENGELVTSDTSPEWPGFQIRSRWDVSGTVEHWGHIHERQNQFCAIFRVEPRDGLWKITDMKIEEQKSTSSNPRLRQL
ncbi:MAG: hypothetical protein NXI04_18270 [Planctomycetaceae bacterium]|nr:hypothetical protein [Planctomycetaceae bacterium]